MTTLLAIALAAQLNGNHDMTDDLILQSEFGFAEKNLEQQTFKTKEVVREKVGRPVKDRTGERFGKLVIQGMADGNFPHAGAVWVALCDCGHEILLTSSHLSRAPTHCGCMGIGRGRAEAGANGYKPERIRKTQKGPNVAFNMLYASYKQGAAVRKLEWALTKKEFALLTKDCCYYCGCPPKQVKEINLSTYLYNGVDRYDNNVGYWLSNVVACCSTCNQAKGTLHGDVFIRLCVAISDNHRP